MRIMKRYTVCLILAWAALFAGTISNAQPQVSFGTDGLGSSESRKSQIPTDPDLPPFCAPARYLDQIISAAKEALAPDFLAAITEYQRNYAISAYLAKRERIEEIYNLYPEVCIPIIQPCLASDARCLLALRDRLHVWSSALQSVWEDLELGSLPAKERNQRITAWASCLDTRADYVRNQLIAWLRDEPKTQQNLQKVLQLAIKQLTTGERSTKLHASEHRLVDNERRNTGVAQALELLGPYLPTSCHSTSAARFQSLRLGIQGVCELLALPRYRSGVFPIDLSWWCTCREAASTAQIAKFLLDDLISLPIKSDQFPATGGDLKMIKQRLIDLESDFLEKTKMDEDWPDFGTEAMERLALIAADLVIIDKRLAQWKAERKDSPAEEFDECAELFKTYPAITPSSSTSPED